MAYDVLQESAPAQAVKEYLKTLKLAAEEGETPVGEALRELLERKAEAAITVESIGEVLRRLNTILPVTEVEMVAVNLASFDELCAETAVRQLARRRKRGRRCWSS